MGQHIWCDSMPTRQVNEYILDRMIRDDASGSADKAGGMRDLWGDMAKKMITWDFSRQRWLAQANSDEGTDWASTRARRTPLVKMPGNTGWYRPLRSHTAAGVWLQLHSAVRYRGIDSELQLPASVRPCKAVRLESLPCRRQQQRRCQVLAAFGASARTRSLFPPMRPSSTWWSSPLLSR